MIRFCDIWNSDIDTLIDALTTAGINCNQMDTQDAKSSVAHLLNEISDLRLYDSDTGDLIRSDLTDDEAAESALSGPEGHILVDNKRCYIAE